MKYYLMLLVSFFAVASFTQVKEMAPNSIQYLNLSVQAEQEFEKTQEAGLIVMKRISEGVKFKDLSQEEKDALSKVDETREDYWDIIGAGCSWYCGGGPKDVTASSYLRSQGANTYEPENAHDLNYKYAWVEGVSGYGIGEYLEYTFSGSSPRITEIKVITGYIKSKSVWENNSRVKKLKVYIDDQPFAILNLNDIRGVQSFKVAPIGNNDRTNWETLKEMPDWTLKFEILDVYKGLKYDDVAITEIYFDGLDVHCFAKGTKVLLADSSTRNIEELKIGDVVAYKDFKSNSLQRAWIEKTESAIHSGLVCYHFESGLCITATQDHPFKVAGKGWASIKPGDSAQYKGFKDINKITVGDSFLTVEGFENLISIEYLEGEQETYTISKLSSGNNFIANGLIVGVEEPSRKNVISGE